VGVRGWFVVIYWCRYLLATTSRIVLSERLFCPILRGQICQYNDKTRRHAETTTNSVVVCYQVAVPDIMADSKCLSHIKINYATAEGSCSCANNEGMWGGEEVELHSFLNSTLDGSYKFLPL
jgi:hypothetical protein